MRDSYRMPRGPVEPGATVQVASAAVKAMAPGLKEVSSPSEEAQVEPGPLDGSIEDLTEYLAGVIGADEVQALIDAETAGKSRKGALEALKARHDELLAA